MDHQKAGFGIPHQEDEENDEYKSASDVGCLSNEYMMKHLPECLQSEDFDYFDDDLATEADSEDVTFFIPGADQEVESDDDDQCVQENPKISISETKDCLTKLNTFATQTSDVETLQLVKKLQIQFEKSSLLRLDKQAKITAFFK